MENRIWPNEKGYIIKEKEKRGVHVECEVMEHLYKSCQGKYDNTNICRDIQEKYMKCFEKKISFYI